MVTVVIMVLMMVILQQEDKWPSPNEGTYFVNDDASVNLGRGLW